LGREEGNPIRKFFSLSPERGEGRGEGWLKKNALANRLGSLI